MFKQSLVGVTETQNNFEIITKLTEKWKKIQMKYSNWKTQLG